MAILRMLATTLLVSSTSQTTISSSGTIYSSEIIFTLVWTSARRNFAAADDDNDDFESEYASSGAGPDTEDHAIDHVDTDDVLMFCCFSILVGRIFPGIQESHYETI